MMSRLKYFNNGNAIPRNGHIIQPFERMSSGIGYHPIFGYGVHGGTHTDNYDELVDNINENLGDYDITVSQAILDNLQAMEDHPENRSTYIAELEILQMMNRGAIPEHSTRTINANFIDDEPSDRVISPDDQEMIYANRYNKVKVEEEFNQANIDEYYDKKLKSVDFSDVLDNLSNVDFEEIGDITKLEQVGMRFAQSPDPLQRERGRYILDQINDVYIQESPTVKINIDRHPEFKPITDYIYKQTKNPGYYSSVKIAADALNHILHIYDGVQTRDKTAEIQHYIDIYNKNIGKQEFTYGYDGEELFRCELPTVAKLSGTKSKGKDFEDYFVDNIERFDQMLKTKNTKIISNDKNDRIKSWDKEFYIFDTSTKQNDYELKNFDTMAHSLTEKDILKDGGIGIQIAKLGTTKYMPLYTKNEDHYKMYNVLATQSYAPEKWINKYNDKNVSVIIKTPGVYYEYDLTKDKNLIWSSVDEYLSTRKFTLKEKDLKQMLSELSSEERQHLFIPTLPSSYKRVPVYSMDGLPPSEGFIIPYNKLKKGYLRK